MGSNAPGSSSAVLRTLLVTDLVDSTKLLEKLGDQRAFEIFGRHDRLARDLLVRHGGREIDKTDGFLLLFERPIDAVGYALAYHQALADLSRDVGVDLQARAGIHLGEVWVRENPPEDVARGAKPLEVEGLAKPMAARLMSVARGRQTLLTRAAFDLARRAAVDLVATGTTLEWRAHGVYAFKGVEEGVRVYEVGVPELSPLAPPPDSAKVRRLRDEDAPSPKAARWRRLSLVLAGAAGMVLAVAGTVAVLELGQGTDRRTTVAVLGFNNWGPPEAAWISTALAEALNADLATGGEVRTVSGEAVARARQELGLDTLQTLAEDTLELLRRRLGADLFVAGGYRRAGGSGALDVTVWAQEAGSGEQVANRTERGSEDGLFDLVAAMGNALRLEVGLGEASAAAVPIRASFPSSVSGTRLYAEGLEALRAFEPQRAAQLLEQAAALDPEAPLVHEALSAAWRALGYDGRARQAAGRAHDLAAASEGMPKEQRLLIDARHAEATGRWDAAASAYADLFDFDPHNLDYGLRLAAAQSSAGQGQAAMATVEALRRLPVPQRDDPRIDLQEARAARILSDHRRQLEAARRAIAKGEELKSAELVASGHVMAGQAAARLGDSDRATGDYLEAKRLYEDSGNRARVAQSLNLVATDLLARGDLAGAKQLLEQSLEVCRQLGDRRGSANALGNLAVIALQEGDLDRAGASFDEVISLFRETGNRVQEGQARFNLALVRLDQGRFAEARVLLETALGTQEEMGRRSDVAHTLSALGELLFLEGEMEAALDRHRRALALREELGESVNVAESRLALGEVLLETGPSAEAASDLAAAAEVFAEKQLPDREATARALLGEARQGGGDAGAAAAEVERALALAGSSGDPRLEARVALSGARVALAAGDHALARERLVRACASDEPALRRFCLEARIVGAQIDAADGRREGAVAVLKSVAREAGQDSYGLVARRAEAALTRL